MAVLIPSFIPRKFSLMKLDTPISSDEVIFLRRNLFE